MGQSGLNLYVEASDQISTCVVAPSSVFAVVYLDCNLVTEEEMIVEWKEEKREIWRQVGTDRDGEMR